VDELPAACDVAIVGAGFAGAATAWWLARRGVTDDRLLCAGPGRLCQALAITREHDGLALDEPPFELRAREHEPEIVCGPRIGITKAVERPWRYGLAGSRFLSRPFRASPAK